MTTDDPIFPAKLWAIYKHVTTMSLGSVTCSTERVFSEKPFSSERECQKRVDKLNEGYPDKPYHYRLAEMLDFGGQ